LGRIARVTPTGAVFALLVPIYILTVVVVEFYYDTTRYQKFLDLEAQVDDEEAEEGAEFDEDGDDDAMRKLLQEGNSFLMSLTNYQMNSSSVVLTRRMRAKRGRGLQFVTIQKRRLTLSIWLRVMFARASKERLDTSRHWKSVMVSTQILQESSKMFIHPSMPNLIYGRSGCR